MAISYINLQDKIETLNPASCYFVSSPACKIEVPERLIVSHEALVRNGLVDRCVSIPVREATDKDILLVHRSVLMLTKTPFFVPLVMRVKQMPKIMSYMYFVATNSEEYLEAVKTTPYMTLEDLKEFTLQYGDTYFHPVSTTHNISFFASVAA